jgi:hypothetical protein
MEFLGRQLFNDYPVQSYLSPIHTSHILL